jgi:hypothetical protein
MMSQTILVIKKRPVVMKDGLSVIPENNFDMPEINFVMPETIIGMSGTTFRYAEEGYWHVETTFRDAGNVF